MSFLKTHKEKVRIVLIWLGCIFGAALAKAAVTLFFALSH